MVSSIVRNSTSTRRFFCRFSGVSFGKLGLSSPSPARVDLVGRDAVPGQIVARAGRAALGQALVVGLAADRVGMTDHGDAADTLVRAELGQQCVERGDRIGAQRRGVEIEERIAVQAHLVADQLRLGGRRRVGHLAQDFDLAERLDRPEALPAERIAQHQPAARVVAIALELAVLAQVFAVQRQAEAAVAEILVEADRDGLLIRIVLAALVVEAAAQAQQRLLEVAAEARADAVVVGPVEEARDRLDRFDLRVAAVAVAAADDVLDDVGGRVDQALVGDRMAEVAVDEEMLLLEAETDADLAVLPAVLVAGREHLEHALAVDDAVLARRAVQPVVAELHAAGSAVAEPELAGPGRVVLLAEDAEQLAEHVAVVVDAERHARIGADVGQRNRRRARGGGFGRRLGGDRRGGEQAAQRQTGQR
ncbi:MAG: hypothetical protein NVV68_10130 [Dokdonella sp.]|nr:hypothetical protein [Dokdonella sp.]